MTRHKMLAGPEPRDKRAQQEIPSERVATVLICIDWLCISTGYPSLNQSWEETTESDICRVAYTHIATVC